MKFRQVVLETRTVQVEYTVEAESKEEAREMIARGEVDTPGDESRPFWRTVSREGYGAVYPVE